MKLQTCLNFIALAENLIKDRLVWIDRDANVWRVLSVFVALFNHRDENLCSQHDGIDSSIDSDCHVCWIIGRACHVLGLGSKQLVTPDLISLITKVKR